MTKTEIVGNLIVIAIVMSISLWAATKIIPIKGMIQKGSIL